MRVICVGPDNPLPREFETASQFHESHPGYFQDLYETATPEDPFSEIIKYNSVCIMMSAPVTVGKLCKRVPFLIDTGCGKTIIHQITFDKLLGPNQAVPANILIGRHRFSVIHSKFATECVSTFDKDTNTNVVREIPHLLGYLNILGMDFLNEAVPDLHRYLHANLSRYQPPLNTVLVTDGTEIFGVKPKQPVAWALKKAIADYLRLPVNPVKIRIRDPAGRVLIGKDVVHAGIEYIFELP
jgi:hypothetical protein